MKPSILDKWLQQVITAGFMALLMATPWLFTWFNEELFEFNKMLFVYAISSVIFAAWAIRAVIAGGWQWRRSFLDLPLAIFLVSQFLATIFSIHLPTSIFGYYGRFNGGLLSWIAYIGLYWAMVNNLDRRELGKLTKALLLGVSVVLLIAIPEHFGRSFNCLVINTSRTAATSGWHLALQPSELWQNYNVNCWIQDVQNRVFATIGQPNWLAAYLIGSWAWLVASSRQLKSHWRLLATIMAPLLVAGVVFSKSRSGFLGLLATVAWFTASNIMIFWQKKGWKFGQKFPAHIWISQIASLMIIGWFGTVFSPGIAEQIWPTNPTVSTQDSQVNRLDIGGTDSGIIRQIVWAGAINIWRRYPLFGSGVETFAYSYYLDRPAAHNLVSEWDYLYNKAHNEFLNFFATTGTIGGVAYIWLLGWMIFGLTKISISEKNDEASRNWALAAAASALGLSISNFFGFSTVMINLQLLLLPAMAVVSLTQQAARLNHRLNSNTQKQLHYLTGNQLTAITCIIALLIAALGIYTKTWWADFTFTKAKQYHQQNNYVMALPLLDLATQLSPREGLFWEEYSLALGKISLLQFANNQATLGAQLATQADLYSQKMLESNPRHLNFYKSRTQLLYAMGQVQPKYLIEAKKVLTSAQKLSPTDPKIKYNLGLISYSLGDRETALNYYEQAVVMRPDYENVRMSLAEIHMLSDRLVEAISQYQYVLDYIQPNNELAKSRIASLSATLATQSAKLKPTK